MFPTPVLLITYNRPELTRRVFEEIRKIKPKKLYFAADGARNGIDSDTLNCIATRQVLDSIDWDCKVETLFREENIGANLGVWEAINWFFSHESEGIVLEDDCLPIGNFFQFCHDLLELYRNDNRVMHIGGSNFLEGWHHEGYDYYFSRNGHILGWATWRTAWNKFGFDAALYQTIKDKGFFNEFFVSHSERAYWLGIFDQLRNENATAHWFHRWTFSRFVQSGLAVVPKQNLIKDLSIKGGDAQYSSYPLSDSQGFVKALSHPPFVIRDMESDKRFYLLNS